MSKNEKVDDLVEYPPTVWWDLLGRKVFDCDNCGEQIRARRLTLFVSMVRAHVKECWF